MEVIREKTRSELACRIMTEGTIFSTLHWHDNYEIVEPVKKRCKFLVDGYLIEANPGDIISIREREVHQYIIEDDDVSCRMLQFPVKLFLSMNFKIKPIKTHIKAEEIDAIPGLRSKLDGLFEILCKEKKAAEAKDNPFSSTICESICYLLMSHFPAEAKQISENSKREMFFKAVEFINSNYKRDISIDDIAEYMDMSRNRIVRLFESYSNRSLKGYIDELRIAHANRMINSGISITDAAVGSGFSCIRTFNNVYKKYIGVSPSEYVKQHKKSN